MSSPLRLALVLHNHQPVGNFDEVCEHAFQSAYIPFLNVFREYPVIRIGLHLSGSLLEWLESAHPEYLESIAELVDNRRIEIIGGPRFEPVLPGIPRADRVGQIKAYSELLRSRFGAAPKGLWLPERVWEQSLVGDLTRAGMQYTLIDDFHFQQSAVPDNQLHGYHLTEDEGRLLKVFPISERMRYCLPFEEPQAAIDHLRWVHESHPGAVVTFGDDGEKFGSWPGTSQHVYGEGWLHRFFRAVSDNQEWLQTVTLSEAAEETDPVGTTYLADCSYREMTDWSLPADRQRELKGIFAQQDAGHDPVWWRVRGSIRRGFWRNFRSRYPEVNEMYARMIQVSRRVQLTASELQTDADRVMHQEATTSLYRAQCNCPYWHGAFGGLYLPHLRQAVYEQLITAETLLDRLSTAPIDPVTVCHFDQNLDGRSEVVLKSSRLTAFVAPSQGGMLYELDVHTTKHNLLATLNRRNEPYHEDVRNSAHQGVSDPEALADRPHEAVRFKQANLDQKLIEDHWPRKSLVDHVLRPEASRDQFRCGFGLLSDFHVAKYDAETFRTPDAIGVTLSRAGNVEGQPLRIEKTIRIDRSAPDRIVVQYTLSRLPVIPEFRFGVELQFAGIAAGAPDRYVYGSEGEHLGGLEDAITIPETQRVGLVDEWRGEDINISLSQAATVWTFPIETISASEGGFEAVHQSTLVMPTWKVVPDSRGEWSTFITMTVDATPADARELSDIAEQRIHAVRGPHAGRASSVTRDDAEML